MFNLISKKKLLKAAIEVYRLEDIASWTGQSGTEYKEVSLATLDEMRYCGNKLLGWMPLPEAPKEETE